eukprot:12101467-Alexandrium_andersonii.AAC.1
MSASLVGSEMCIRDRVTPACRLRRTPGRPLPWCRSGCWGNGESWRVMGSVSYTHLTLPTICSV